MKQNSGAKGSADQPPKRMSAVEALRLSNDDSEEDEFDLEIDYPDSELREEENVDLENISVSDQSESDVDLENISVSDQSESDVDLDNISVSDQSESDVDLDLDQPGPICDQQRGGRGTRPRQARTVSKFEMFTPIDRGLGFIAR